MNLSSKARFLTWEDRSELGLNMSKNPSTPVPLEPAFFDCSCPMVLSVAEPGAAQLGDDRAMCWQVRMWGEKERVCVMCVCPVCIVQCASRSRAKGRRGI